MLVGLAFGAIGHAAQERYEYDPIGRLVRWVDGNNQVTDYSYDPAGNILSVTRSSAASLAPVISSVAPSVMRRGQSGTITFTGQRLQVGTLQAADPGLALSNIRQTATQVIADLSVGNSVPTGSQTFTFSNALGSAQIALVVAPKLPVLTVEPNPLALPPDNSARSITLRLSNSDVVDHDVAVASSDVARATVSPASVRIAAGQTTAQVQVTPKTAGFLSLMLTSPTLSSLTVPVFVTADFRGVNTSYAAPVGVQVGEAGAVAPVTATGTLAGARVGVAVGPVLTGMAPAGMVRGTTQEIVLSGVNIPAGVQVTVVPPDGVTATVGPADGQRIALTVEAAASAATGPRRLVVKDAAGNAIAFTDPVAALLRLTTGQPVITSVEPLFAARGTTPMLKVRGRHLQDGVLTLSPSIDLRIDSAPVVNADGTELVGGVQLSPLAAGGPRLVQVATPSGQSGSQPTEANQFTIVSEVTQSITPIISPMVGVMVGAESGSGTSVSAGPLMANAVGVVMGQAATGISPVVGVIGTSLSLTVNGAALQSVQTVTLAPATGLTLGAVSVAADGSSLSLPLTVASDAPRTLRRVVLNTAAGPVPFSSADGNQFLVAAPAPVIESITPQVLPAGKTTSVVVRGINLSDVRDVRFEPAAGLTALGPFIAAEGNTLLAFLVQVDAAAQSGVRTVVVDAAGGASTSVPSPANTVQVAQQVGATHGGIVAPAVGVLVGTITAEPVVQPLSVVAPLVGVTVAAATEVPGTRTDAAYSPQVGVVVGTAVARIEPASPDGFLKNSTGLFTIKGSALDQVTSVVSTGTGVTFGPFTVSSDATQITLPVTVSPSAGSGVYGVRVRTGAGTATYSIAATQPGSMAFSIGSLPTGMDSISPIVLEQGKAYTLTVRGTGLKDVYQLVTEPAQGLDFSPGGAVLQWSTDALGEKLTVPLLIDSNAAIGSRVVRLRVPGGSTSSEATPANTITIVAPQ